MEREDNRITFRSFYLNHWSVKALTKKLMRWNIDIRKGLNLCNLYSAISVEKLPKQFIKTQIHISQGSIYSLSAAENANMG